MSHNKKRTHDDSQNRKKKKGISQAVNPFKTLYSVSIIFLTICLKTI